MTPYCSEDKELEKEIEENLTWGESYGTPCHFFQNMYWKDHYIGREFHHDRNIFENPDIYFSIYVPVEVIKSEDHEKYGLHHNGEEDQMYACLERIFNNLGDAIEFVKVMMRDFPGAFEKCDKGDQI